MIRPPVQLTIDIEVNADHWPECQPYIVEAKLGVHHLGDYFGDALSSRIEEIVGDMLQAEKQEAKYGDAV